MAAPKRTPAQREADLETIARYYLQGCTQRYIGQMVSLSQPMIRREIGKIRELWLASALRDFDAAKSEQLAKLDNLEAEYWGAWIDSKKDKTKKTTEQMFGGDKGEARKRAGVTTEERDGNPAFLAGIERVCQSRAKLLGLDAPTKVSQTTPDGEALPGIDWASMSESALNELMEAKRKARDAGD